MSEQIYAGTEATAQDGAHGVTRPTTDTARGDARPTGEGGPDMAPTTLTRSAAPLSRSRERGALRLPPVDGTPVEKRSFRQIEQAQRANQAHIELEATVRRLAREGGSDAAAANELARASWGAFRMVNGEPIPVQADRQTVVLGADGNVMSVTEWVAKQIQNTSPQPSPLSGEGEEEVLPRRNPFRRKTWNLTEQMQLARRDPRQAKRLKAEARAEGE